jgi:mxaJ protein
MPFASPRLFAAFLVVVATAGPAGAGSLRVCADPDNLPYSNAAGEGFENRIVAIVADELGLTPEYVWHRQDRGFLRETLLAGRCDLIPGYPSGMERVAATIPYYRSSYVFLTRAGARPPLSFDDPLLAGLTIGIPLAGDDGANPPPAAALARRGLVRNLRGFPLARRPVPGAVPPIVAAVADGTIDVAVLWGPIAGYYATRVEPLLAVTRVSPLADGPRLPMAFAISMAVRAGDDRLRQAVGTALDARAAEIDRVLAEFGVPRLDRKPAGR